MVNNNANESTKEIVKEYGFAKSPIKVIPVSNGVSSGVFF